MKTLGWNKFRIYTTLYHIYKLYIKLALTDRDYHCFAWRKSLKDPILDYRMTYVTFGVPASSFISNMAIKQNAYDHANEYPLAAKVVHESFYMDDGLTGADTIEDAQKLQ